MSQLRLEERRESWTTRIIQTSRLIKKHTHTKTVYSLSYRRRDFAGVCSTGKRVEWTAKVFIFYFSYVQLRIQMPLHSKCAKDSDLCDALMCFVIPPPHTTHTHATVYKHPTHHYSTTLLVFIRRCVQMVIQSWHKTKTTILVLHRCATTYNTFKDISKDDAKTNNFISWGNSGWPNFIQIWGTYISNKQIAKYHSDT